MIQLNLKQWKIDYILRFPNKNVIYEVFEIITKYFVPQSIDSFATKCKFVEVQILRNFKHSLMSHWLIGDILLEILGLFATPSFKSGKGKKCSQVVQWQWSGITKAFREP